jgi:hypothetical protein
MDKRFAEEQAAIFERDKQASRQVTLADWQNRSLYEKVVEYLAGFLRSQV